MCLRRAEPLTVSWRREARITLRVWKCLQALTRSRHTYSIWAYPEIFERTEKQDDMFYIESDVVGMRCSLYKCWPPCRS